MESKSIEYAFNLFVLIGFSFVLFAIRGQLLPVSDLWFGVWSFQLWKNLILSGQNNLSNTKPHKENLITCFFLLHLIR